MDLGTVKSLELVGGNFCELFFFMLICENENSGLRRFSVSENITDSFKLCFCRRCKLMEGYP